MLDINLLSRIGRDKMYISSKYKSMPVQVRASIWYTVCNILQKGISFITIPVYTRLLTATEYGNYSVFQSWRDIIIIFATLNLYCGVFTKAMVDFEDDRNKYTSSMQGLSTVTTLILFIIYWQTQGFWNDYLTIRPITVILLFLYYIFNPAFAFWSVRQRVEYRYTKMIIITLVVSMLVPVISMILLKISDLREKAIIWGYLFVQIVVGMFFYGYQFFKGRCFYNKKYWLKALKFNIPLIPHYLSLIILGQADRIMISNICGSDKAGIYSLAYQVSMLMNVVISAINSSLVPWIYEKLKNKEYLKIKKATRDIGVFVAVMSVCTILVAPEIIRILGTKEYLEAIWIIPSIAISVYFTYCYGLYSGIEFYFSATKFVMVASSIGAALNIILNAIFIPLCGFIVAGYTTLACYLCFMLMHYFFMKRICKKRINGEGVFDHRFISISCVALCIIGMFCILMYKDWILRYTVIVIAGVFIILNRNVISSLIKSMKE